jgi:hypothetical protein
VLVVPEKKVYFDGATHPESRLLLAGQSSDFAFQLFARFNGGVRLAHHHSSMPREIPAGLARRVDSRPHS